MAISLALAYGQYDGGGTFVLDVEGTKDLPDEIYSVEALTEWGLTDQDIELSEGNRMFTDEASTSGLDRHVIQA